MNRRRRAILDALAPAITFAAERADGDERIDTGYALVFPLAMILKLIIVQLLI